MKAAKGGKGNEKVKQEGSATSTTEEEFLWFPLSCCELKTERLRPRP